MRALIQRVSGASVQVDGKKKSDINAGLLILLGIGNSDGEEDIRYIVEKCLNLRVFKSEKGEFDLSVLETKGQLLLVSQFTLMADCTNGRRPDFKGAASAETAADLYRKTVSGFKKSGLEVGEGEFRAHMMVSLVNDGPVTILLDSKTRIN